MVKVSLIIPVYNSEEYLKQCLDSIINQSLEDIEVICINDGSTDESLNILNSYSKLDNRIKVIDNKTNKKQGFSRNRGLDLAIGEYILFVDSDDWLRADACETLYNMSKDLDCDLLYFLLENYSHEKESFYQTDYYDLSFLPYDLEGSIFNHKDIKDYVFSLSVSPCQKFYKRELVENIRFPEDIFFEDNIFHWDVILSASKISLTRQYLYFRRIRNDSVTSKGDEKYLDTLKILPLRENIFKKHNLFDFYKKSIVNAHVQYLNQWFEFMEIDFKQEYWDLMKEDFTNIKSDEEMHLIYLNNLSIKLKEFYLNVLNSKDFFDYINSYGENELKEKLHIHMNTNNDIILNKNNINPKISIILSIYNNEKYLITSLSSILNQTYDNFEIICVDDGSLDNSLNLLKIYAKDKDNIKIISNESYKGLKLSLIQGLKEASGDYVLFLSADDWLDLNTLDYFVNILNDMSLDILIFKSLFYNEDKGFIIDSKAYEDFESIGKEENLWSFSYKNFEDIKKEENTPFYSKVFNSNDLDLSFKFKLDSYLFNGLYNKSFLDKYFMNICTELDNNKNKLSNNLETNELFIKLYEKAYKLMFLDKFIYTYRLYDDRKNNFKFYIKHNKINQLVINSKFPPFDDVSGMVLSKRIILNKKPVDVIYQNYENSNDFDINNLIDFYIGNRIVVENKSLSNTIPGISTFVREGIKKIEDSNNDYKYITSRAWTLDSHFLAMEYKLKHPEVKWTAEFSDPLIYDIYGKIRQGIQLKNISNLNHISIINKYIGELNKKINSSNDSTNQAFPFVKDSDHLYYLVEYLPFLFADIVRFTNKNQREVMLSYFDDNVKDYVIAKSEVKPHPTLDNYYYHLKNINYEIDNDCINFGYFGLYAEKRDFNQLFEIISNLDSNIKSKIKIHMFLSNFGEASKLIENSPIFDNIIINPKVSLLDCLNLTTKMDVLLVNDTITEGIFKVNPYLPSKFADYFGSGKDIWAFVEDGSILSNKDLKYKSYLNNVDSIKSTLNQIIDDKLN